MVWAAAIAPEPIASFRSASGSENHTIQANPCLLRLSGHYPPNGRIATTPEPWGLVTVPTEPSEPRSPPTRSEFLHPTVAVSAPGKGDASTTVRSVGQVRTNLPRQANDSDFGKHGLWLKVWSEDYPNVVALW
jgi:hypothetical protein